MRIALAWAGWLAVVSAAAAESPLTIFESDWSAGYWAVHCRVGDDRSHCRARLGDGRLTYWIVRDATTVSFSIDTPEGCTAPAAVTVLTDTLQTESRAAQLVSHLAALARDVEQRCAGSRPAVSLLLAADVERFLAATDHLQAEASTGA